MKEFPFACIVLGSLLPGVPLMVKGLYILGAFVMAVTVIVSLGVIGGYLLKPEQKEEKH